MLAMYNLISIMIESTSFSVFPICKEHLKILLHFDPYSRMNMRQLHILFNSAKTWNVIVCWFLCFTLNLPELNLRLFCSYVQNNFRFSSGKFRGKHRNQQPIKCQVLAELNKIWSCLIIIKLYLTHLDFCVFQSLWTKMRFLQNR